jgi:hypothetical protein
VAWGSPICPSAFAAVPRTTPFLIPKRLDEGGGGLGVADLSQRLRRRPAHHPLLIPKRLDEGGGGLGVADLPQRLRRRQRTSLSSSRSAWMRAGVAWGSPICPSASPPPAHSQFLILILILILERLQQGGEGLWVTDLPQRPRRRPAHPPLLILERLDEGGGGLGVADLPQRLRRRLAHPPLLILERLDEGGDGGWTDLPQRLRRRLAHPSSSLSVERLR